MQKEGKRVSRRWRTAAVLALGVAIGTVLVATPAASHIGSVTHLWNAHIKPRADTRYVNVNELKQLGMLRAQKDAGAGGTTVTAGGRVQVNSVSISTSRAGFLVISGHAFINSDEAAPTSYVLVPKVDGTNANATGWGSTFFSGADLAGGERFELSYTTAYPVAAGAHTVTQDVGPFGGTATYFYNNNELVVQWIPAAGNQGVVARPVGRASNSRSPMGN
jgi:hypothetical protein